MAATEREAQFAEDSDAIPDDAGERTAQGCAARRLPPPFALRLPAVPSQTAPTPRLSAGAVPPHRYGRGIISAGLSFWANGRLAPGGNGLLLALRACNGHGLAAAAVPQRTGGRLWCLRAHSLCSGRRAMVWACGSERGLGEPALSFWQSVAHLLASLATPSCAPCALNDGRS